MLGDVAANSEQADGDVTNGNRCMARLAMVRFAREWNAARSSATSAAVPVKENDGSPFKGLRKRLENHFSPSPGGPFFA
jgi:hypothetical protein